MTIITTMGESIITIQCPRMNQAMTVHYAFFETHITDITHIKFCVNFTI